MKLNRFGILAVVVCLFFLSLAARAADPFAEGVRPTEPLTPAQQQQTFHLPPDFEIQLVAAEPDLRKPMNMAFDVTGRLWITESREYPFAANNAANARDTIRIFSDFDTNGRARVVTTFATNLNIPIGLYPFRSSASAASNSQLSTSKLTWKCIAWSIPNIWQFEDTDGDGKADKQEILYGPFDHTRDTHGNQASFRRGSDGWLYATHGFNNDSHVNGRDGHEVHLNSGNIYRMRLDGSRIEHWTHGQVNPFGLCFDPLGNLYSADCHSSPIYQLLRGAYYPSFGKPDDGLGFAPVTIRHSHGSTAICGIVYISDPAWPAEFQDNILVGNVMTSRLNRDRLVWRGSTSVGHETPDFLTTDDPWFRPVDLQWGPDGALYVADFYNRIIGHYEVPLTHPGRDRERGRIWRIVYKGAANSRAAGILPADLTSPSVSARPSGTMPAARSTKLPQDSNGLIAELMSANPTRRSLALNELTVQADSSTIGTLQQAARGLWHFRQGDDRAGLMAGALWLLQRRDALDSDTLLAALADRDAAVRVHALRLLAERGLQAASTREAQQAGSGVNAALRASMITALQATNAFVQRAAAEALGLHPEMNSVKPLIELLVKAPAEDTHLRHVARMALRNHLAVDAIMDHVSAEKWPAADLQPLVDVALAVKSEKAALFLLHQQPSRVADASLRRRLFEHIARYAPVDALNTLAETVTSRADFDTDFQLALFQTVQQGFARRGAALTPKLRQWGTGLARNLLVETGNTVRWGNTPFNGVKDTTNPWTFQERRCADGQQAQLMSSHPLGEQLTGRLRSVPFDLPPTLNFYLCGHDGFPNTPLQKNSFVRLRDAQTGAVLREVQPPRHDTARLVTWEFTAEERATAQRGAGILPAELTSPSPLSRTTGDAAAVRPRRVFIEAVDGNTQRAYAWLAFGRFKPELPELTLTDPNQTAHWQQAGAELAQSLKLAELLPRLTAILRNTATDFTARAAVASAVASLQGDGLLVALAGALKDLSLPEPVRRPLAAAIAGDVTPARAALETAMQHASTQAQQKLARLLAANSQGADLLLSLAEAGKVAARVLTERTVKDRLAALKPKDWEARVAKVTANLPPDDAARQKLVEERKAAFNATMANATKGAAVFTQVCAVCHQVGGQGALVGPQLDGIGNRGLERLLEDILDPNRNVDHAFRSQIVVLKDGDVVSGLVRREEGAVMVMVDSTGKEVQITKANIATRRESESSLMPDNYGEAMTPEQLRDLLGFLLSQAIANAAGK